MRERVSAKRNCPFCGRTIAVVDTTTEVQEEAGLVYLGARCITCEIRIDAAGIGSCDALKDFDQRLAKREGKRPEDYRIRVRPEQKRGRRRWR